MVKVSMLHAAEWDVLSKLMYSVVAVLWMVALRVEMID